MKLSDIYLGTTDAKNELLTNSPEERLRFKKLYVVPPALIVDKYINHSKYFITGLKGTGKTALLRYISIVLDEQKNTISKFILFKSEVSEETKKDFSKASRIEEVIENSSDFEGNDFENVWRWFIYKVISDMITQGAIDAFQKNENLSKFHTLMRSEKIEDNERSFFSKLIPSIRKGNIEISKDPKLNLDFDWDSNGVAKVAFYKIIQEADSAFQLLQPSKDGINIFFDELELNYTTKKQYQRDSRLLRDLIVTIERINSISKKSGFNLCLFAAIRSEVLNSVDSLGKEINKPLTDFGTDIVWNRAGVDSIQQPLLHIVEQRINNSREEFGLDILHPTELWSNYFPKLIHYKKPQTYLLHNSWYRPRDIVRLLLSAQESYPEENAFSTQSLEAIRKRYSSACWVELTEELKAKYKSEEINGIKNILYGYAQISTIQEISTHAESIAQSYVETKKLLEKNSITAILIDLYRIGVIGNYSNESQSGKKRFRFSFRGDDDILLGQKIYIHNALKAHLSID
ncbi:hypothetical protein JKX24_18630 [Serratia proteamaculans]|uniref:Uncharacterized protein n=1 Tax=Serratia proteamaculans TaxID=28151 RepID=A0A7U0N4B1_SERPR|nr:hypothetical protein [Serratia proteamaculans]MBO1503902.1 hypothetical protein [Serratia proteamaculans]MDW5510534.1 hypothetical protein [Serratia proteamaculans]QQX52193.1 hypothetical protein JKX24_18630 [Serratia proteamaculans]